MDQETINKMRARVEMCRRLAKHTHDHQTAQVLREMADEGETDVQRLQAELDALSNMNEA